MPAPRPRRKKIPKKVELKVLTSARSHCCLCYYLDHHHVVVRGQIAHLDHNRDNHDPDNLCFLCPNHHDLTETKSPLSRGVSADEVKLYRDRLYKEIADRDVDGALLEVDLANAADLKVSRKSRRKATPFAWPLRVRDSDQDYLFAYKSPANVGGVCHIHRRFLFDKRILIICSQLPDNPGRSITNCVEDLAFQVCQTFRIDPDNLVWVEHYGAVFGFKEFSRVQFEVQPPDGMFQHPSWSKMKEADWRELQVPAPKPREIIEHSFFNGNFG